MWNHLFLDTAILFLHRNENSKEYDDNKFYNDCLDKKNYTIQVCKLAFIIILKIRIVNNLISKKYFNLFKP